MAHVYAASLRPPLHLLLPSKSVCAVGARHHGHMVEVLLLEQAASPRAQVL